MQIIETAKWDEEVPTDVNMEILCDLALSHCRLAGDAGQLLASYINAKDYKAICEYEVDYCADLSVNAVINIRQALAFFTKLEFLDIGVDKEAVARSAFYKSEVSCLRTNQLFNLFACGEYSFPRDVQQVFDLAERKIAEVLGAVPSLSALDYYFGPGATTSVRKTNACARTKLSAVPSCSTNLLPMVPRLVEELPMYMGLHRTSVEIDGDEVVELYSVVLDDGKISFVPKNAKTYRTVMTEPTLNSLVQGGFGRYISQRLLRVGQDTRDQGRNQVLAREGSLTGGLATLDLSMASDSISTELVAALLPYEWFAALSLCRTPTILDKGKMVRLHKFSSMGNGFTFPLQTLIFWALASSCAAVSGCAEKRVSVYGDDIIVGTDAVSLLRKALHCAGFTLNASKSYWGGPFRESCGKDYYFGIDVRPFYAKHRLSGEFLFLLHNFYKRRYDDDMANRILGLIPPSFRIFGPDGFGDGHIISCDWHRKQHRRAQGYSGFLFETFTKITRSHRKVLPGDFVLPAYSQYVYEEATDWLDFPYQPVDFSDISVVERAITPHNAGRDGVNTPELTLPGTRGYKRISIYTLSP